MKIAVIGTGNVGRALGGAFVRAGHDVTLAARDAEKTKQVAAQLGATAAANPGDAAAGADVVVVAIPYAAIGDVADEIREHVEGKVVVDVTNPAKTDYSGLATEGGPSAGERLAARLPGARVGKAFNTIFASIQADPRALGTTVDGLFAIDDDEGQRTLGELIRSVGFRPVHVGTISAARELEALAWLNIRLQLQTAGDWHSTFVLLGAPAAARAA
jgi:predicted dinucleotide-binding enzyme